MATWIATRRTAQGSLVHLWADGALTWALGRYIKGSAVPRTSEQVALALRAGWLVLGDVELYDDGEVPALIAAARWTANRGGDPGMMRQRLHKPARIAPAWTILEADRDGRPLVRCWVLPRLLWPGMAVFAERGAYSIHTEIGKTGTYAPTGVSFRSLLDLTTHLESEKQTS